MSRPWLLVILLLLIVFTSQFEWKQQLGQQFEESPKILLKHKQQYISNREETIKEKIILSQEQKIHKLNELVGSLREQLLQCRGEQGMANSSTTPLTRLLSELEFERQQILED